MTEKTDLKVVNPTGANPLVSGVGRPASDMELANWDGGLVGGATIEEIYRRRIKEIKQEYTKQYIPFCSSCAIRDMREALKQMGREIEKHREAGKTLDEAQKLLPRMPDFESYGNIKDFRLVGYSEARNPKARGASELKFDGLYENYRCKKFENHNINVFVPLGVWIERNPKESRARGYLDKEGKRLV